MRRPELAVHTVRGWTFRAGSTLRAELPTWEKWAPDEEVASTIREGWKGLHVVDIAPAWFWSYEMNQEAAEVWHQEHTAMWQAGVVSPITKEWVRKHVPPDVLIPHFMIKETDKYRVIADARYPNVAQRSPWFPLCSASGFAEQLHPGEWWCKQDLKAGWHHIWLHVSQSKMFGYVYQGQIWVYQVLAFGDSTAPYIFQKTLRGLQRFLQWQGWCRFSRYLDDVAAALGFDQEVAAGLCTLFRSAITHMGLVRSVKKSPPPAKAEDFRGT